MNIEMEKITEAAPVQYQGKIDSCFFYFHSRWEHWTFAVADDLDSAIVAYIETANVFYREARYGTGQYDASYMPVEEAERIIRECALEYQRLRET